MRRTLVAVSAAILPGLPAAVPAAAQPELTEVVALATKSGFRGVFAWRASEPVVGVVRFGTSPATLDQTAMPIPDEPDTAAMVVAQLVPGETYYYQIEDLLSGARSAIGSLEATNAYTDWNGSAYTIDLLVQLDSQSLPPEIPADQALADIAAGINVLAERVYDALDGHARVGKVLITDTGLDYAANAPFFAPACLDEHSNLADVLVQTTVPFDSHTFGGWSIDDPCISFYVGRIGQLVVPWEDDLHFGYVSTHELMHYAFNAPDLYLTNSDADCRNLEWDGSLMHNTGGWNGKWELTELDRNPTLTPCDHGTQPYSWDALRTRYTEVPLNPDGPIGHVFDELARGNADGGALEIHILDREPGASTLTTFTPDDQVPACGNRLPQVVDPAGDATGAHVVGETPAPSDPSLDVTRGFLTWDADARAITFHVEVEDLSDEPLTTGTGHFFRFYFNYAGQRYQVIALRDALGENRTLRTGDNTSLAGGLDGAFDPARDEVTVVLPADLFAQAVPTAPPFAEGEVLDAFEVLAQRFLLVLTLTADTGSGSCSYRIGQEKLAPNNPPVAAADAAETAEDGAVTIDVLANDFDPDGDPLSLESVSGASGGTAVKNPDGTATYTPDPDFHGTGGFSYTAGDGRGGTASAGVTVTVHPEPDPPTAVDDAAATPAGQPVTIDVLADDSDPDGDPLAITAVTQGSAGGVAHDGSRVTYAPGGGFTATDSFTYTVSDPAGHTATATVTVYRSDCLASFGDDLEPAPEPGWTTDNRNGLPLSPTWAHAVDPLAQSPTHSFFSDATDLSANKDDRLVAPPQGVTPLTRLSFWHRFRTEERFDGGVLEVSTDGGVSWRDVLAAGGAFLQGGYTGTANALGGRLAWTGESAPTMSEVIADLGALAGETVLVRWRLQTDSNLGDLGWWIDDVLFSDVAATVCEPTNRAPVAFGDEAATQSGQPVTIDVLANDSDPDGDPLTVTAVGEPANGTASHDGAAVTYAPESGFAGTVVFSYTVSDGNGGTDDGAVTVRVNGPPEAADDEASTAEDQPVTIDVLANDSDPNGDPLTVTGTTAPGHGTAAVNGDGTVLYSPEPDYHGPDAFGYTVSDGRGGTDTGGVSVGVTAVNDRPEAVDDAATTGENEPVWIDVLANDSDVDGDPLQIVSVSPPSTGTARIHHRGTAIHYRPRPHFTGTATFTYTVEDGRGGASTAVVTLTVTGE